MYLSPMNMILPDNAIFLQPFQYFSRSLFVFFHLCFVLAFFAFWIRKTFPKTRNCLGVELEKFILQNLGILGLC